MKLRYKLFPLSILALATTLCVVGCSGQQDTDPSGSAAIVSPSSTPSSAPSPTSTVWSDLTVTEKAEWLAEMDQLCRDNVIAVINEGMASEFGYTMDSQAEKESIKFYDLYITDKGSNRENNYGYDLVVRYMCNFDDTDEAFVTFEQTHADESYGISIYYAFDEFKSGEIKSMIACNVDSAEDFLSYLIEEKDFIEGKDGIFNNRFKETVDRTTTGCIKRFTATDFQDYMDSLAQSGE